MRGRLPQVLRSIRFRLTAGVTLLFALSLLGTSWLLVSQVRSQTTAAMTRQSAAEAQVLAAQLEASGEVLSSGSITGIILPAGQSGTEFTLVDPSGTVVAQSDGGVIQVSSAAGDGYPQSAVTIEAVPLSIEGQVYELRATSPMEPVDAAVEALARSLAIAGPLLILAVALLAWGILGRALRPVEAIIARTDEISAHNLDERVPVPASGDEVARLAGTMNRMLGRIQAAAASQRRFVSDASHELRSPVTASRTQLEVALRRPQDADWVVTAQTVLGEQERLSRLVDDLLLTARLDEGGALRRIEIDLDDVVFEEASRTHSVCVDVSGVAPVRITGDPVLVQRLVRNLVDNAVRHAAEHTTVSLGARAGYAVLVVEDDGTGVPLEQRESVFDRFSRLEDARSRDGGGAGLGLALVRQVARAHGGEARVVDSALGGARFEVRLPLE